MNRIIRMWNYQRKEIIIIGLAVVFFIIIKQALNEFYKQQNVNENTNVINTNTELPTKSVISGEKVSEESTNNNVEIIDKFIKYCNEKNIQEAYNLLTEQCKQVLFPTQEIFKENYCDVIFTEKRIYNITNWITSAGSNTYLIEFFKDAMATGIIESEVAFQDYITVNQNNKISINSFITYEEVNKSNESNGVKITILNKKIYKDYEQYEIEVKNGTNKTILLDTRENKGTIYIKDKQNLKYSSDFGNISNSQLRIAPNTSSIYNLRFNIKYSISYQISSMVFSNIVLDYEKYESGLNNDGPISITVDI